MMPLREDEIAAQAIQAAGLKPEWCDAKGARVLFSLSRSHLYQLTTDGKVKSSVLRKRGTLRGRRLFSCQSIRALLEANIKDSEGTTHTH
jgi:hypothetical protein